MPRLPTVRVEDLSPGDKVRGQVDICPVCGKLFVGAADAKYCSPACNKEAYRARMACRPRRGRLGRASCH